MSLEAKTLLLNRVEESLSDKLTVKDSNTAMITFSDELQAFDVEHASTDYQENGDTYLKAYLNTKALEGLSPKTLERYEYEIKRMMHYLQIRTKEITIYHIRGFLAYEKQRGLSENTLRGKRDIFHAYFGWLHKESLLSKDPSVNLEPVKVPKKYRKPFSDLELEMIKESCKTPRDKALVRFLLSSGCRVSEVIELNRDDVDFGSKECIVHGKGNKERKVFLDLSTIHYLKLYLDEDRFDHHPALFLSSRIERLTAHGVRSMLKIIEKRSGVENVHPHRFRRTLATHLIDRGCPIQVVSLILGHDKLDTTMKYISYTTSMIKESYSKYY